MPSKCITCKKSASYGLPCNRPNKCTLHKEDGMIKNPTARCRKKNCNNTAIYGSKTPLHCEAHKVSDDVLLVERHCEKCGILDVLLNGLCVNFCCMEEKALEIKKYQKVKVSPLKYFLLILKYQQSIILGYHMIVVESIQKKKRLVMILIHIRYL